MKLLAIYNSKTGFTKKYIEWLKEEINCDTISIKNAGKIDFNKYDTILFGSWFHAGMIQKLKWFKNLNLEGKRKIVLATGATPSNAPDIETALTNNFKEDRDLYQVFYVQGGLDYEKMSFMDRKIMGMFSNLIKKKEGEDSEMYKAISASFDASSKEALIPLISFLQK